jgi:hypothetical protein
MYGNAKSLAPKRRDAMDHPSQFTAQERLHRANDIPSDDSKSSRWFWYGRGFGFFRRESLLRLSPRPGLACHQLLHQVDHQTKRSVDVPRSGSIGRERIPYVFADVWNPIQSALLILRGN